MSPIYTGVGDRGLTQLGTGEPVTKSSPRIETYGAIDELSSNLGLLRDQITALGRAELAGSAEELMIVQRDLFVLASEMAFPATDPNAAKYRVISVAHAKRLEKLIDQMTAVLPPLRHFIIPGGHPVASQAHVARTVCRRMERVLTRLHAEEPQRSECLVYVNRLSDWIYTLARFLLHRLGGVETRA